MDPPTAGPSDWYERRDPHQTVRPSTQGVRKDQEVIDAEAYLALYAEADSDTPKAPQQHIDTLSGNPATQEPERRCKTPKQAVSNCKGIDLLTRYDRSWELFCIFLGRSLLAGRPGYKASKAVIAQLASTYLSRWVLAKHSIGYMRIHARFIATSTWSQYLVGLNYLI